MERRPLFSQVGRQDYSAFNFVSRAHGYLADSPFAVSSIMFFSAAMNSSREEVPNSGSGSSLAYLQRVKPGESSDMGRRASLGIGELVGYGFVAPDQQGIRSDSRLMRRRSSVE